MELENHQLTALVNNYFRQECSLAAKSTMKNRIFTYLDKYLYMIFIIYKVSSYFTVQKLADITLTKWSKATNYKMD